MIETTNLTDTGARAMSCAAYTRRAADLKNEQEASVEHYRAFYCALMTKRGERVERSRHLEAIKMQRRKTRRGKWLQSIKSLASVLSGTEALN